MLGKYYFVYIIANRAHGALYIGVTSDLKRRIAKHRSGSIPGFTKRYGITMLVYYQAFDDPRHAIAREKQLKAGSRIRKIKVIERFNENWTDLYDSIAG